MTYLRSIPECPASYTGSLSDLYQRWIRSVLVPPDVVEAFHWHLTEYLRADNPLFLTRKVRHQERGVTVTTADGACMCTTSCSRVGFKPFRHSGSSSNPSRAICSSCACGTTSTAQDGTSRIFSM